MYEMFLLLFTIVCNAAYVIVHNLKKEDQMKGLRTQNMDTETYRSVLKGRLKGGLGMPLAKVRALYGVCSCVLHAYDSCQARGSRMFIIAMTIGRRASKRAWKAV